jgi:uncharacterized membrane protein YebE (DUF533 family)
MESQESQPIQSVAQFVEKLISSRRISYQQYHQLSAAILADGQIDEEERYQINRLFDAIQAGRVKIINKE